MSTSRWSPSVVSDWTGIPVGRMVKDEIENVLRLPEILNRRVVGQSHGLVDDRQAHRNQPRQARQSQQADRRVHAVRALGRRQDRDRARARRSALWRRAEHDHHQHVGIPGGAHGLLAEGRAARLCRLRRGRPAHRGGAAQALQRHPARRGREGPSRRARDLLPGVRQGLHGRRQRPPHRLQEHADHPDHQCRHQPDHGAFGRSEISRGFRGPGAGAAARTAEGVSAGAARAHGLDSLLSAVGQDAGRHRAPAARPHRPPHPRQPRRRLSSTTRRWSITSCRCATIRIRAAA